MYYAKGIMKNIRRCLSNKIIIYQLIIIFFLLINTSEFFMESGGIDFYNYWVGVLSVRKEPEINFYDRSKSALQRDKFYYYSLKNGSDRQKAAANYWQSIEKRFHLMDKEERLHFFLSTPFLYFVMNCFITENYDADFIFFSIMQIVLLIFSIVVIMHYLDFSLYEKLFAFILFIAFFSPYFSNMRAGNSGMIQLGFLSLVYILINKSNYHHNGAFLLGVVLSCMVLFKPTLFFIPCLLFTGWLTTKQFKKLFTISFGMLVGGGGAIIFSSIFFKSMYGNIGSCQQ